MMGPSHPAQPNASTQMLFTTPNDMLGTHLLTPRNLREAPGRLHR